MMVPVGRISLLRTVAKSELVDALAWLTIPAFLGPLTSHRSAASSPLFRLALDVLDQRALRLAAVSPLANCPKSRWSMCPRLDVKGFLLSGVGLSSLVFGMTVIGRDMLPGCGPALRG